MHFFNTLLVSFLIPLWTCLTKFESIKLKCYFTTLLYAIAVYMLFLEFSSKMVFLLHILSITVRSFGSFYNRSSNQITEMTISLFNLLVNFTKNVLVYTMLANMIFLTLLGRFSSLWNFMTHLFYCRLLTSFFGKCFGKVWLTCYVEILNQIQAQGLISLKASQSATGISIA